MATGKPYRTIEARPNAESLVKPGELVDLVEVTPLTLADRRIYNQLLENAWDAIDKPVTHVIAKADLRGSHNSNDRVGESIERLMSSIVKVRVTRDGEEAIERVQLLGGNIETTRRDGLLEYEIPQRLRRIIKDSTVFARLQREVMFALSSKYALTLYEMIQKRGNLRYRSSERFSLEDLRGILGVAKPVHHQSINGLDLAGGLGDVRTAKMDGFDAAPTGAAQGVFGVPFPNYAHSRHLKHSLKARLLEGLTPGPAGFQSPCRVHGQVLVIQATVDEINPLQCRRRNQFAAKCIKGLSEAFQLRHRQAEASRHRMATKALQQTRMTTGQGDQGVSDVQPWNRTPRALQPTVLLSGRKRERGAVEVILHASRHQAHHAFVPTLVVQA